MRRNVSLAFFSPIQQRVPLLNSALKLYLKNTSMHVSNRCYRGYFISPLLSSYSRKKRWLFHLVRCVIIDANVYSSIIVEYDVSIAHSLSELFLVEIDGNKRER